MTENQTWLDAASTICFKPYGLSEAIRGLAEAGFTRVEISAVKHSVEHLDPDDLSRSSLRKAQTILDAFGVAAVSISGHGDLHTYGGLERHRRILNAGAELGVIAMNTYSDRADTPAVWPSFVSNARTLADEAYALGATLCIENHNPRIATAADCGRLVSAINHPAIKVNYDCGNASFIAGVNPAEDIDHAIGILGHVHLKDHRGGKRNLDFPALGEGDIDIRALLQKLARSAFSGPVSLEVAFNATWPTWEACLETVRRSYRYWRSLQIAPEGKAK